MALDIKKFLDQETLSLKKFGEWLSTHQKGLEREIPPQKISSLRIKDPELLRRLVYKIKGEKEGSKILRELEEGSILVENQGEYLVTLVYSNGKVRVPKPLIG